MSIQEQHTPLAILGGGPAGYIAAIRAVQLGGKAVLVEETALGGICMNQGCIPTKALLRSSGVAVTIRSSKEFGVESSLERIAWNTAVARKNRAVKNLHISLSQLMDSKGITVLHGKGSLISDKELLVESNAESTRLIFDQMIVATGSEPSVPPIKGIDSPGVIGSTEALELTEAPESIAIVGAGVIGLEFAAMFRGAGSKVTVLEAAPDILHGEDQEVAAELLKIMKRQGIGFKLSATVKEIAPSNDGLTLAYHDGKKDTSLTAQTVLMATGRKPRSNLVLPFRISDGAIAVDSHMETSIKGIYAAGDVIGGRLLAHLAYAEGKVAAENALGHKSAVNYNAVPSCVYTTPEIATVGMNEAEAERQGIPVRVGKSSFRTNGRALTLGEREGFVKIVADNDGTIIGAQILGSGASELISELTLAVTLKANAAMLADMIHPHPSLSEVVWEACGDVLGRSLHGI